MSDGDRFLLEQAEEEEDSDHPPLEEQSDGEESENDIESEEDEDSNDGGENPKEKVNPFAKMMANREVNKKIDPVGSSNLGLFSSSSSSPTSTFMRSSNLFCDGGGGLGSATCPSLC